MDRMAHKGVCVFAEQVDGAISSVSFELLGKAQQLAQQLTTEVTAVLLGKGVTRLATQLAQYGAQRVLVVDDPALEAYTTEPYAKALACAIRQEKPAILLYGATAIGRDLAPRVSARMHTGLTADCTALEIGEGGNLHMTRPAFGGNLMATILCPRHRPQMATVRPGVMKKHRLAGKPEYTLVDVQVEGLEHSRNVMVEQVVKTALAKTDIADAKVLVAGGRGMGCAENFAMLEELAGVLGGAVAASRASVDAGWQPKQRQVGQTGKTVRPTLYIACGISGAAQHLAGMEESDSIIAINKDATAPMLQAAEYGLVGDACKIVPLLTQAIREAQKKRFDGT